MNSKKCVLAFSGGLDTSAIVVWLIERGYEVHAVLIDVGQDEDLDALCAKAMHLGAKTSVIRDAKPQMFDSVIPYAIGLQATYEGKYRLGTALARPFIAQEQVRLAKALGGATLIHGATGKGNDQIRFEYVYRTLAPECPVLAPWKTWEFDGRKDLIAYLREKGFEDAYDAKKDYSLDENLWHLSVEGSELEDAEAVVNVPDVLDFVKNRFSVSGETCASPEEVEIAFHQGVPTAINGETLPLGELVKKLNHWYRHAPWAWELIIENRATGIKSRGLYINPAAKLLHTAIDALACTTLNKPTYDRYAQMGADWGGMLYRGEYFCDQRLSVEAGADVILKLLNGTVTLQLSPQPYASRIMADSAIFRLETATFEKSDYSHADAAGFINLSWLSLIGKTFDETNHASVVETKGGVAPDVCQVQPVA